MSWKKYDSSVEDYLKLDDRYDVRFEYWNGSIRLRDGTPVILIGGATANEGVEQRALVVIADATEGEVERLVEVVGGLRSRQ
jgi:hypothetical protein